MSFKHKVQEIKKKVSDQGSVPEGGQSTFHHEPQTVCLYASRSELLEIESFIEDRCREIACKWGVTNLSLRAFFICMMKEMALSDFQIEQVNDLSKGRKIIATVQLDPVLHQDEIKWLKANKPIRYSQAKFIRQALIQWMRL